MTETRNQVTDVNSGITVVHAPEKHRYELHDAGAVVGFTKYRLAAARNQMVFIHTEVDEAYAGRGLAGKLAGVAVADVVASGRRVVPICPYIASYLRRHRDFEESVDWPADARGADGPDGADGR